MISTLRQPGLRSLASASRLCSRSWALPSAVRCASTSGLLSEALSSVPAPPPLPVSPVPVDFAALTGKVPGLGDSMWPFANWLGSGLDAAHAATGLEWWAVVGLGAVAVRILAFPVSVSSQKMSATMHNIAPESKKIQARINEGQASQDFTLMQEAQMDLKDLYKRADVKPLRSFGVIFIQGLVFMTFFWTLRMYSRGPVEGFTTEGLPWFPDLSEPVPSSAPLGGYVLSIFNAATVAATLHMGADMPSIAAAGRWLRYVMMGIPVIVFFVTLNFPAGLVFYWCVSNTVSLFLAGLMRIPALRGILNIPQRLKHKKVVGEEAEEGVLAKIKSAFSNDGKKKAPTLAGLRKQDAAARSSVARTVATAQLKPLGRLAGTTAAKPQAPKPSKTARDIQADLEKRRRAAAKSNWS